MLLEGQTEGVSEEGVSEEGERTNSNGTGVGDTEMSAKWWYMCGREIALETCTNENVNDIPIGQVSVVSFVKRVMFPSLW